MGCGVKCVGDSGTLSVRTIVVCGFDSRYERDTREIFRCWEDRWLIGLGLWLCLYRYGERHKHKNVLFFVVLEKQMNE